VDRRRVGVTANVSFGSKSVSQGTAASGAKRTLALDAKSKAACSARSILERGWHLEAEAMGSQRIDSTLNLDKIWGYCPMYEYML
jgi:hypothetical protein